MKEIRTLVCFTASYPYGTKETFFENELPYLADEYDCVYIVPKYNPTKSRERRRVSGNVIVTPPCVSANKFIRIFEGIFNRAPISFYIKDFFHQKLYRNPVNFIKWFNSLIVYRKMYSVYKRLLGQIGYKHTLYAYWAEAPLFIADLCKDQIKIVRMHRSDFYLDVNRGYLPVRSFIYEAADLLLPISREIKDILQEYYKISSKKIFINYLGVDNQNGQQNFKFPNDRIRIVSCSRVDPIKRVDIIAKAISRYNGDFKLEWHHFGDGKVFEGLKVLIEETITMDNIKVVLHGWTSQNEIYDFYKHTEVTWFVNVSAHEGVPVSIMEAQSFGIPVIATDVGATREIVSDSNGFLLERDIDEDKLLNAILRMNDQEYKARRIASFETWKTKFVAKHNYKELVVKMRSLS